ncbi:unnamed protein product [Nezara viridula]|uniref:Uncharacterized protein n=1 Tax=Nezara viridula TaxID=85310 RepID=A0A9P0H9U5_NEZVI|nr:unnamed protein product [Nezara viridula]
MLPAVNEFKCSYIHNISNNKYVEMINTKYRMLSVGIFFLVSTKAKAWLNTNDHCMVLPRVIARRAPVGLWNIQLLIKVILRCHGNLNTLVEGLTIVSRSQPRQCDSQASN